MKTPLKSHRTHVFRFKHFAIKQETCPMKVGTDGVLLGAWVDMQQVSRALDVGTGTGLIALMLAQRSEQAIIEAVDIDGAACAEAQHNATASPWASRIHVHHMAVQDLAPKKIAQFDLVVSNPPFFSGGVLSSYQDRNVVRHTVKLPHGDLLAAARTMLRPQGRLAVILPYLEGLRFGELAATYGFFLCRRTKVRPKPAQPFHRLLLEFSRDVRPLQESTLTLHDAHNHRTKDYIKLTENFYIDPI